eukprot:CAMPEP_0183485978 /NCGR_PEP_ID=MMETSP0370-20130417/179703_1 /TAXON_ID=268820 /ORGANISM="Peridinium aciculiferum, Strain PAER-2" /LENGTH=156 /DNA_ID=CAMNT_0025679287 /DNA_START=208 /DNA_END=678 /DNA_ORIENTATION=+
MDNSPPRTSGCGWGCGGANRRSTACGSRARKPSFEATDCRSSHPNRWRRGPHCPHEQTPRTPGIAFRCSCVSIFASKQMAQRSSLPSRADAANAGNRFSMLLCRALVEVQLSHMFLTKGVSKHNTIAPTPSKAAICPEIVHHSMMMTANANITQHI